MKPRRCNRSPFLLLAAAILLCSTIAGASESSPPNVLELARRIDVLEARLSDLETQVGSLKQEKRTVARSLDLQRQENAALKSQLASLPGSMTGRAAAAEKNPALEDRPDHPTWAGVRAGYQGFPFGQKEGGFYYGAFVGHRLIDHREGMPYGDLDFEFGAGVARSGNDQVTVNSSAAGGRVNVELRQRMISIWPDLKYQLNPLTSWGFSPYVTGGPGIWIDIIETPPLTGALQYPPPGIAARKLPVTEGASLFEGGQGGAGFELSLARTGIRLLQPMHLGFDYRYSAWTTGQRFSTYSMLLTYGE
jgi:hypothetical protein